jgi:hypothetical protein
VVDTRVRRVSFTLRYDNDDHKAIIDWIEGKRVGRKRLRHLREHVVRAMLNYIDEGPGPIRRKEGHAAEPLDLRSATTRELSNMDDGAKADEPASEASALAAQSMNF